MMLLFIFVVKSSGKIAYRKIMTDFIIFYVTYTYKYCMGQIYQGNESKS
jgi:hypothetical protein